MLPMDDARAPVGTSRLDGPPLTEPPWPSLLGALDAAAVKDPDGLFVDLLDTADASHPLSWQAVRDGAVRYARALRARGLAPGDRVVILVPTSEAFLFGFFGTWLAGGVPVPCPMPLTLGSVDAYVAGFEGVVADADARLFVTTRRAETAAAALLGRLGRPEGLVLVEDLDTAKGLGGRLPNPDPDDLALLQYTSGPVVRPAGVALTHRQIALNVEGLGAALGFDDRDVGVVWIPLVHDMGLIGVLLTSLRFHFPVHVMPPEAFLMRPHRWLGALSRFRATVTAGPNAGYHLAARRVTERHLAGLDLSSLRLALDGAEMVRPATLDAFASRFAPAGLDPASLTPLYGLAENALAATCPAPGEPIHTVPTLEGDVVSVGRPLPGQSVGIFGPDDALLPPGRVGEIRVSSPSSMQGYYRRPGATAAVLQDGWLRTGDLGVVSDGRLHITGRRKPMVIKMGRNYYPADVEAVLAEDPALAAALPRAHARPNPATGTEDLVLELDGDPAAHKALEKQVNGVLLARLGIRVDHLSLRSLEPVP